MTRGKILYINNDSQIYVTCEFNSDMHPHIHTPKLLYDFIVSNDNMHQKEV